MGKQAWAQKQLHKKQEMQQWMAKKGMAGLDGDDMSSTDMDLDDDMSESSMSKPSGWKEWQATKKMKMKQAMAAKRAQQQKELRAWQAKENAALSGNSDMGDALFDEGVDSMELNED